MVRARWLGDNGSMPKISAATVAEHRVAQREALISAAEAIIAERGVDAVTPRSVGERAGLARSSFYEYFASKDDLLAAIALDAFAVWTAEVNAAVEAVPPGRARLHTYVTKTMSMAADGKHSLATQLRGADLSPTSHETIMAMHDSLVAPLRALLEDLGVDSPATTAMLVQGMLGAAVQGVDHGASPDEVAASIIHIFDSGV
jgi:AcrR family transcriptional regulator